MLRKKGLRLGGRPQHDFWIHGKFVAITDKNKPAALCKICSKIIRNTAKRRLLQHRRNCKISADFSSDTDAVDSETDSNNDENIQFVGNSSTSTVISNREDGKINIEVEDSFDQNYSTFYSHPDIQCAEEVIVEETTFIENQAKKRKKSVSLLSFLIPSPSTSTDAIKLVPQAHKRKVNEAMKINSSSNLSSESSLSGSRFPDSQSKVKDTKDSTKNNLNSFIDSMSLDEKGQIDRALAKFIFGCNIPFAAAESDHFKKMVCKLRPAYKLPARKTIATTLLDEVYDEMNDVDSRQCGKESVLLIDGWKNSTANTKNVVTMIHNNYGHVTFLESFDFSEQSETGEELSRIVMTSKELAQEKYLTDIYAVVSDNASNMLKMGRLVNEFDILHSGCNSHMGNLLAKEIVDEDTVNKVTSLQKEFKSLYLEKKLKKKVVLSAETRWCSHRNTYENFLENLTAMRQIVIDEQVVFKGKQQHLLFDDDFLENVKLQKEALDPVCKLVNKCQQRDCSLADAVEMWLTLEVPEQFKENLRRMQENVFTKHALAANYLHPLYRGQSLSLDQIEIVEYYLYENLSGPGIESLNQFKYNTGILGVLSKKENLSPMSFWESLQNHCKHLANFAIKLLKIPVSSAQLERVSSNWSYVHSKLRNRLTEDRSKKLLSVYYSLKTKDTNKTDEY